MDPANQKESLRQEARRRGVSVSRVRALRKNAAGLCAICPAERGSRVERAGLCGRHYDDHVRRSRERMARLWREGKHPDQVRKARERKRKLKGEKKS